MVAIKPNNPIVQRHIQPSVVFFGTPEYVVPVLDALDKAGYGLAAVVTQPPKPVGKKQLFTPSPVAQWAEKNKIPVITKPTQAPKADVAVVAAYGKIISSEIISKFAHGVLNIHPSLLPAWRGPSPIEAQLAAGAFESGITFIKVDEKMDHGPIVAQYKVTGFNGFVSKKDALTKMFQWSAEKIPEVLHTFTRGPVLCEQNHKEATYTNPLNKDHGFIPPKYLVQAMVGEINNRDKWKITFMQDRNHKSYEFGPTVYLIGRLVKTLNPWPGTWTYVTVDGREKKLKILDIDYEELPVVYDKQGWETTEHHKLILKKVQLEGKKPVSWKQFQEGYPKAEFSY